MDIWTMVVALSRPEGQRAVAQDRLVATGSVAVVPVLAALWEEIIPWAEGVEVLRRVSLDGFGSERERFESLVNGVCSAKRPEGVRGVRRQRLWAQAAEAARWIRDPEVETAPNFLPDPSSRHMGGRQPSWAPLFVPLLNQPERPRRGFIDPAEQGRAEAEHDRYRGAFDHLVGLGDEVVPMLRAVRRSPLRQRREALKVLACIGWRHLDARDQTTMKRHLTRMAEQEPPPDDRLLAGEWYALQTGDQEAVIAELGLFDPVTVPVTAGLSATSIDNNDRVYVSPAINGWTLVVGQPGATSTAPDFRDGAPCEVVKSQLTRLSRRFGKACHFRLVDEYEDSEGCNVWRLADNGTIICEFFPTFDDVASDRWAGLGAVDEEEFHTWLETNFMKECGTLPRLPGEPVLDWARRLAKSEENQDGSTLPTSVYWGPLCCRAVSAQVAGWFGPGTRVEGAGVLTLTDRGRRYPGHKGLLWL